MFPRLSPVYRILIIVVVVFFMVLLFNSQDTSSHKRLLLRQIQGDNPFPSDQTAFTRTMTEITVQTTTRKPEVNPHNFRYVLNPTTLCNMKGIRFLIYVHSAPKNYKKRQMVRQTWASKLNLSKYKMRLVFIMGSVDDTFTMDAIRLESDRYGDIVVENFLDTYRNLTYKAVASLKWVSNFCKQTTFVMKSDDDILIDINAVMDYMNSTTVKEYGTKNLIMCNQWTRMQVIRDKKSKWYISKEEFPEDVFPPYCSGSAFIMTIDVVLAMYNASLDTKFFWVDDFYLTGLLVKKINVQHKRLNDGYMLNSKVAVEKMQEDHKRELKFFHVRKLVDNFQMWEILKARESGINITDETFTSSPTSSARNTS